MPVLALYAEATQWNQRAFASTVQLIFVVLNVASMLAVGINHATIAAVTPLVPCLLLGAVAGRPLAHRVPVAVARRVMLVVAFASALIAVTEGILGLIH